MLGFERGMGNTGFGVPLLTRAVGWAHETGTIDDSHVRDALARVAIDNEVAKLLTQRTVWLAQQGGSAHAVAGSVAKIFATESYQKAASALQALAAPFSLLGFDERDAAADGYLDHDARHSVPQTLQGGTSEINRNNIAERGLGLPRAR
jgi:alkylation response protein AidB-like acyl-CoA dehydrogenase